MENLTAPLSRSILGPFSAATPSASSITVCIRTTRRIMASLALDQRSFLRTSFAAGVGAGALTTLRSVEARAQSGVNLSLYTGFETAHNIASGDNFVNRASGSAYASLSNIITPMQNDWYANGGDRQMAPVYAAMNVPWMKSVAIDLNNLATVFQQFNPGVTAGQLSQYRAATFSALTDSDYNSVLNSLRSQGLAGIFAQINIYSQTAAKNLGAAHQIAYPILGPDWNLPPSNGRGYDGGSSGGLTRIGIRLLALATAVVSLANSGIPAWGLAGLAFLEGPVVPAVLAGCAIASLGWSAYTLIAGQ